MGHTPPEVVQGVLRAVRDALRELRLRLAEVCGVVVLQAPGVVQLGQLLPGLGQEGAHRHAHASCVREGGLVDKQEQPPFKERAVWLQGIPGQAFWGWGRHAGWLANEPLGLHDLTEKQFPSELNPPRGIFIGCVWGGRHPL